MRLTALRTPALTHFAAPLSTTAVQAELTAAIDCGGIDVWRINLDSPLPVGWQQCLPAEDFDRAARFVFQTDRTRFLCGHFSMRSLLGRYCAQAPRDLAFVTNTHGKPALSAHPSIGFNLSHSGNQATLAVGRQNAIGIDIERVEDHGDSWALAQQLFSDEEMNEIDSLSRDALIVPFLTGWTRKEACLKALGVGLSLDPRRLSVGLLPTRTIIPDPLAAGTIEVITLDIGPDTILSLAVRGAPALAGDALRLLEFDPRLPMGRAN